MSTSLLKGKLAGLWNAKHVFVGAFISIAILRLYFCTLPTAFTGDAFRHVVWGVIINEHGFEAIKQSIHDFYPNLNFAAWDRLPYNYPILDVIFDSISSHLSPNVFTYKFLLTAAEAFNNDQTSCCLKGRVGI
jgi:hypothetical protein